MASCFLASFGPFLTPDHHPHTTHQISSPPSAKKFKPRFNSMPPCVPSARAFARFEFQKNETIDQLDFISSRDTYHINSFSGPSRSAASTLLLSAASSRVMPRTILRRGSAGVGRRDGASPSRRGTVGTGPRRPVGGSRGTGPRRPAGGRRRTGPRRPAIRRRTSLGAGRRVRRREGTEARPAGRPRTNAPPVVRADPPAPAPPGFPRDAPAPARRNG